MDVRRFFNAKLILAVFHVGILRWVELGEISRLRMVVRLRNNGLAVCF